MRLAPFVERLLADAAFPEGESRVWLAGAIAALAILALTFATSWLAVNVVSRALRRVARRTATDLDDRILEIVEQPLRRLIVAAGGYFALSELPLPALGSLIIGGVLVVVIAVIAVRLATQIALVLLLAYGRRVDSAGRERFEKDFVPLISKVLGVAFVLVGLVYVLNHFNQNVTSVIAALGIGGAVIGLAAKDMIAHMFAGFVILIDRPFRPGDNIKLATGEIGTVVDVGTRSTRVRLVDLNQLIVPNSDLMNSRVVNLSFPRHPTRAVLDLTLAFGSDIDAAREVVVGVLRAQPEVAAEPPPAALVTAFTETGAVLSTAYVVAEDADAGAVQDRVRVEVLRRLLAAGHKLGVPMREVVTVTR